MVKWFVIFIIILILAVGAALILIFFRRQRDTIPFRGKKLGITQENQALAEGLVAFWSFDEEESFPDGEVNGAQWVKGIKGQALQFDGLDDFVEIGTAGLNQVGKLKNGSISLWFKFKNIGPREILPLLYLGEANNQGTTDNLVIEIGHFDHGLPPDKKLYYTVYNQTYEPILCFDSNQNLKENTWYHFVVVNSPSGNTGYLNGLELTKRHYNFSTAADTRFFANLKNKEIFRLGYGWFGIDRQFHYFEGLIDEVRIYNRPLTDAEIKALTKAKK